MSEIKVSVVMPVYNVAEYLPQALESVTGQTLREIEIICVDDGSTDASPEILKQYAEADDRIRVLRQQNQYAGMARNRGLSEATGKYVIFWDPDDFFEEQALFLMYEEAERTQAQIVVCGANRYDTLLDETILTNVYLWMERVPEKRPFSRQDMGQYIYNFATNVPWNKLYLKSFIEEHDLRFEARRQANDTYFVLMAFYYAERMSVVDERLINYRISTSTSLSDTASAAPLSAYESYVAVQEELSKKPDYEGGLKQSFLNRALSGFLHMLDLQGNYETYCKVYQFLLDTGFSQFELDKQDRDFFYSEWMYEDMQLMHKISPGDFLVRRLSEKKDEVKLKNSRIRRLKERRDELKAEREELRARRDELKARRDELKEERTQLKVEIREKNKVIKEQKKILESNTVQYALKTKDILTLHGRLTGKKKTGTEVGKPGAGKSETE